MSKSSAVQRFAAFVLTTWFAGIACTTVSARDDVPDDVKAAKNPVTLEESDVRYYQRQFNIIFDDLNSVCDFVMVKY